MRTNAFAGMEDESPPTFKNSAAFCYTKCGYDRRLVLSAITSQYLRLPLTF